MVRAPRIAFLGLVALALAADRVAAQEPEAELTDPEIAHIAVTANAIDAELGELASRRGANAGVRDFGSRMVTDHRGVNERAADLAERLGVVPADNDVSRSLREGAEAARRTLDEAQGAAFDREYLDREVAYHRAVLEALDGALIPGAENRELRALLEEARGAVAAHLSHAEELREELGGGR